MPKMNVYVPDDLAESVKETGLPVSAICQRALEQSVKRVAAIRAATIGDLTESDPTAGLTNFTQRTKDVVNLAIRRARERGAAEIGTRDLVHGMVTEGTNLALHVLRTMEVEPANVLREVERLPTEGGGAAERMGRTAANAMELTVVEAILLGHNYVGTEHLLLGLIAEPDGAGGEALRGLGVEAKQARQIVVAWLAGYVHLKANQDSGAGQLVAVVDKALEPVLSRLDRLEKQAGLV
jgi:ATP-dependent Clp protease ATP-binding subunit ClpA